MVRRGWWKFQSNFSEFGFLSFLEVLYWVSDLSRITYPKVVSIMRGLWGKLYHTRFKAHFIIADWGVAFRFSKLWLATFEVCLWIFHADFIALWALLTFHICVYKLYITMCSIHISGLNYLVKAYGVPRWNWVCTCPPWASRRPRADSQKPREAY